MWLEFKNTKKEWIKFIFIMDIFIKEDKSLKLEQNRILGLKELKEPIDEYPT